MTFPEWIQAVLSIARDRGIIVTLDYPSQNWVTFTWHCSDHSQFGTAGAGAELVYLTTPEAFTWLWHCGASPGPGTPEIIGEPWDRHGRYVPRVPAMAVSDALQALFSMALLGGMPAASSLALYSEPVDTAGPDETAIGGSTGPGGSGKDNPGKGHDKPKGKPS